MKMGEAVDLLDAFVRFAYNAHMDELKLLFPHAADGYMKEKFKRMEKDLGKFFGDLDSEHRRKFIRLIVARYLEQEKKAIYIEAGETKKVKVKVFLGLVQYRGGENLYVGTTKDEMFGQLHEFVIENWAEYMDQPKPKSIKASISQFFDVAKESGRKGSFLTITEDEIEVEV